MNEIEIKELVGEPAMFEQLAEECVELAHACLKMARIRRGENPTPAKISETTAAVSEELVDVILCALELGLVVDNKLMAIKRDRWKKRIAEEKDAVY